MTTESGVATAQVERVAELAHLELSAEELPRMAKDLNAVLGYIAQLNELDTATVEPMAQVGAMLGLHLPDGGEALRLDLMKPSVDRAEVLQSAPESDGRFFKVPKVIER